MANSQCDLLYQAMTDSASVNVILNYTVGTMDCCKFQIINCLNDKIVSLNFNNVGFTRISPHFKKIDTLKEFIFRNENHVEPLTEDVFTDFNSLEILNLSDNKISGEIPKTISGLTNLRRLILTNNTLTGNIPDTIGSMVKLKELYLNNNLFNGNIPSSIDGMTNINIIEMQNNQLTGEIPSSIGNLKKLRVLNLHNNKLTGSIPDTISEITNLQELYLQNNELTGELPKSFGLMTSLTDINVSRNELSGPVPAFHENVMTCYLGLGGLNNFCVEKNVEIKCLKNVFEECDESSGGIYIYIILGIVGVIAIIGVSYFIYGKLKKEKEINEILEKVSIKSSKSGCNKKEIFNDTFSNNDNGDQNEFSISDSIVSGQNTEIPSPQYYPVYFNTSQTQMMQIPTTQNFIPTQQFIQNQQFPYINQLQQGQKQLVSIQQQPGEPRTENLFMNQNQIPISPISPVTPISPQISVMSPAVTTISKETKNLNAILVASSIENNTKLRNELKRYPKQSNIINEDEGENLSPLLLPIQVNNQISLNNRQNSQKNQDITNTSNQNINEVNCN